MITNYRCSRWSRRGLGDQSGELFIGFGELGVEHLDAVASRRNPIFAAAAGSVIWVCRPAAGAADDEAARSNPVSAARSSSGRRTANYGSG